MKTFKKGTTEQLSANFKSTEFDCRGNGCCNNTVIDEKLISFIQKIRDHFGKPITVNSGYRCSVHNKAVGGSSNSRHLQGMAADIVVKDTEPKDVAKYAESIGVLGIGLYDTANDGHFVHIDTRSSKSFWFGHAQERKETFGGENLIKQWQKAAIADGFNLPSGADGIWGKECEAVAKAAICKKRLTYKYKNLTKFIQNVVGVTADGKFGNVTKAAVEKLQKLLGLNPDGQAGYNTWKKVLGV